MGDSNPPLEALKAAIRKIGSQVAMARLLGVSQPAVGGWVNRMGRLPAEHVLKVEAETGISKHDLRPDIYPREADPAPDGGAREGAGEDSPPSRADRTPDSLSGLSA